MIRSRIIGFFTLLFVFFASIPRSYADFKLLDAIQEFGEKRYLKPTPARLKAGPLQFHPTLRTKTTYDDNILLENNDAREDVIFNVTPGAIIELPLDKHQLAIGYEADFEFFTKTTSQNAQNQNFFALADFHFPNWYVNILEKLTETSDRAGTTFTSRIPRLDQSVNPKIGYKWKRTTFEAGFRHYLRNYHRIGDAPFDFQIFEWSGVVYYDLFARLKALFEYQLAKITYDHNHFRDGIANQIRVGVEGEVFRNLTVKARTGFQIRNYENGSKTDFSSWVANVLLSYQVRKDLKLELSFSREPVEATFGNVDYYKEYSIGFGVEYQLRRQWILFSQPRFYRHDYAERADLLEHFGFRHDNHVAVKTGVRYLFREWLQFELAYQYLFRDSNYNPFDYTDNQFSLSASLAY